ncbi:MAG: polyphosphate kinase 2 family protein [Actinomycetota bacterium]|nr:polyphosphate kinase 2 family protein [Actinomycetota bacterium]
MAAPDVSALLRVPFGEAVDLSAFDPAATPGFPGGKKKARRQVATLGDRLAELQTRLHAAATAGAPDRVLLVLQGTDCSGKDGVGRHVVSLLEPMWVRYASFVKPTAEELRHDFLWRVRRQLPAAGEIGVFNRSHYEDVLIVAVHDLVPRRTWQKRYDSINRFEQRLAGGGVRLVKVMLQISQQEQLDRLRARLADPDKRWKYNPHDVDERHFHDQYVTATEAALTRCNTAAAPWHLVPADHKWYRDWAVAHLLLEALEEVGSKYPPPAFDLAAEQARLDAEG